MAKQNGNMYEWISHTANPLAGECMHKCSYCYVEKMKHAKPVIKEKYTGIPHISGAGLDQISGKGKFIFVCDMTDLFANNVPLSAIVGIIEKCKSKPENKYLLQTKNVERLFDNILLISSTLQLFSLCITLETNRYYIEFMKDAPMPIVRINYFVRPEFNIFDKFVTIEPIMDFDLEVMVEAIKLIKPKQVNIGADSGNNHLPEPSKEKILHLIDQLDKFTIVKQKSNLKRLLA